MSDARRIKLTRVLEVRKRELDQRQSALAAAQKRSAEAAEELDRSREATKKAHADRAQRASAGQAAADWGQFENWLSELSRREQRQARALEVSQRAIVDARSQLALAKIEVEKITTLLDRIDAEARLSERRSSQKIEDELASARAARSERGRIPEPGETP